MRARIRVDGAVIDGAVPKQLQRSAAEDLDEHPKVRALATSHMVRFDHVDFLLDAQTTIVLFALEGNPAEPAKSILVSVWDATG